jgi:DnaJ homologue, subfamily C, member 28, conserved domain
MSVFEDRGTENPGSDVPGEIDGLAGAGKPLEGLDAYFATPEHLRLGYSVLKSAGTVPEEAMLRKEVYLLKQQPEAASYPARRERLSRDIRALELKTNCWWISSAAPAAATCFQARSEQGRCRRHLRASLDAQRCGRAAARPYLISLSSSATAASSC